MAETPPDWAKDRACQLINVDGSRFDRCNLSSAATAFALYISQHETAPVDPDVEAVKRILWEYTGPPCFELTGDRLARAVAQYKKERGNV